MNKINGKGLIVGIIVWFLIMGYTINQSECLKYKQCDGDDLFLVSIIGIGMIGPSYIVSLLVSSMTGER